MPRAGLESTRARTIVLGELWPPRPVSPAPPLRAVLRPAASAPGEPPALPPSPWRARGADWGPRSAARGAVLDRAPILPPRWASGGVPRRDRVRLERRRRATRARGLMVAAAASGVALLSLRVALIPQEALGAARPGPVHVQRPVDRPIGLRIVDLPDPCPLDRRSGHPQVKGLIACEAALWDVPGGAASAMSVAHCESRFQPAAFNPTGCGGSGCGGLFQQSLRYWRGRAAEYGYRGAPPSDPRANVVVSMRMAVEQGTWSKDWPVCGR